MTRVLLQVAQTKAEKYNVGKSLKDDDIQETKAKKENTSKDFVCNIVEISFMYEEGLFDHVQICDI